jgi:hypothetical protein
MSPHHVDSELLLLTDARDLAAALDVPQAWPRYGRVGLP